ncbi:hypothetical protein Q3G72_030870 [Acer saccharum]|nr:hypothetical protein Q3G72_030870 [Acer saccharum]
MGSPNMEHGPVDVDEQGHGTVDGVNWAEKHGPATIDGPPDVKEHGPSDVNQGQGEGEAESEAQGRAEVEAEAEAEGQGEGEAEGEAKGQAKGEGEAEAEDDAEILIESDYEQETDDIAAETSVNPTQIWDSLNVPNRPHDECASGSDLEDVSDELNNLERVRWVKAVCKSQACNWFVYASWLNDHKTFQIKTLCTEHTCAMSFKNKFVNSRLIAEKYVDQWRANPDWNFTGMSTQLRIDTNMDASKVAILPC